MSQDEKSIESEIVAKGLTAPRVTFSDVESNISSEHYFTAGDGYAGALSISPKFQQHEINGEIPVINPPESLDLLTFCVLVLKNGFTVTGESACASPENFDADIGRKIAKANAMKKIWPLMGYALKDHLHKSMQAA